MGRVESSERKVKAISSRVEVDKLEKEKSQSCAANAACHEKSH